MEEVRQLRLAAAARQEAAAGGGADDDAAAAQQEASQRERTRQEAERVRSMLFEVSQLQRDIVEEHGAMADRLEIAFHSEAAQFREQMAAMQLELDSRDARLREYERREEERRQEEEEEQHRRQQQRGGGEEASDDAERRRATMRRGAERMQRAERREAERRRAERRARADDSGSDSEGAADLPGRSAGGFRVSARREFFCGGGGSCDAATPPTPAGVMPAAAVLDAMEVAMAAASEAEQPTRWAAEEAARAEGEAVGEEEEAVGEEAVGVEALGEPLEVPGDGREGHFVPLPGDAIAAGAVWGLAPFAAAAVVAPPPQRTPQPPQPPPQQQPQQLQQRAREERSRLASCASYLQTPHASVVASLGAMAHEARAGNVTVAAGERLRANA